MADDAPKSVKAVKAVKFGEKMARLKARLRSEAKARADAEKERDDLKARPSAEDTRTELEKLRAERRADRHRAAFDRAAKAKKVRVDALDDLWELSKLDTSADEPDDAAITAAIGEKTKARPYLLAGDEAPDPDPKAPLSPGAGSGRGARPNSASGAPGVAAQVAERHAATGRTIPGKL
jgi:hypothetical protein